MTQIYPSFDPSLKKNLGEFIVPDTSVLQLCFTDEIFFRFFDPTINDPVGKGASPA